MRKAAAFSLFLGVACLPPVWGQTLDDPEGTEQYGFRPFAQKYRILPDRKAREELTLGSLDSGTLRFEAEGGDPLPPVVVDNEAAPREAVPSEPVAPKTPRRHPRARLTGLHVSEPAKEMDLKDLTISFTGIDHASRPVKFRYKMEGLNPDWIETDQPSAYYSNLEPGEYRFEVQAINAAGLRSPSVTLPFTYSPTPWWRRYPLMIYLLGGVGMALTGSLYSAVHNRRLLQMERLRASIAANLHDQMGAGLTDIAILSEVAARKAGGLPELDRVAATARDLVDGMGDIVWLVNPRRDSLYELFLRLKDAYAELFEAAGARLDVGDLTPFEGARLPMAYRQNLHLLFQEALRNALRHSGCRQARLTVSLKGRHLEAELRDDGHGFDPALRTDGAGLETMGRRAESLGGRLTLDSSPEGTVVRFAGRIPHRRSG